MVLSDLKVGETAIIERIEATLFIKKKMYCLGFLPGDEIQVVNKTFGNGPLALKHANGNIFAIRKDQAEQIYVK